MSRKFQLLISHVQWLLENGADGVALLGSTGEANSMTLEQRQEIIEQSTRKLPADRLMIGTGSCALQDAIKLTKVSIDVVFIQFWFFPLFITNRKVMRA